MEIGAPFEVEAEKTDPEGRAPARSTAAPAYLLDLRRLRPRAGLGFFCVLAFALMLLVFRFGLSQAWRMQLTPAGAVSWALPAGVLALICATAAAARRRFAEGIEELEREEVGRSSLSDEALAELREVLNRRPGPSRVVRVLGGPGQPPLLFAAARVLAREAAARQVLDPAGAFGRLGEPRADRILAGAQTAVALGLLGSLLGLAVQAWQETIAADASAVFGDDLATGVLVAVSTTIQGVLVAAYAAILERVYRERYAPVADASLEVLQIRVLSDSSISHDRSERLEGALKDFIPAFETAANRLLTDVPAKIKETFGVAAESFGGALTTSVAEPVSRSVGQVNAGVAQVRAAVESLEGAVKDASARVGEGVTKIQQSWQGPTDLAAVLQAAASALEKARVEFEKTGKVTTVATTALGALADRLAASAKSLDEAGVPKAVVRVGEIDERVANLCKHLEEMVSATSRMSAHVFVAGGDEDVPLPRRWR